MERRDLLVRGGTATGILAGGGLLWRRTQDPLAVEVINITDERKRVSVTVTTPDGKVAYTEPFDIGAGGSITRYNVAGAGSYTATLRVGEREHDIGSLLCHTPKHVFEREGGPTIASYTQC